MSASKTTGATAPESEPNVKVIPMHQPSLDDLEGALAKAKAEQSAADDAVTAAFAELRADRNNPKLRAALAKAREAAAAAADLVVFADDDLSEAREQAERARREKALRRASELEAELTPARLKAARDPGARAEADALVAMARIRAERAEVEREIRDRKVELERLRSELDGTEVSSRYQMPDTPSIYLVTELLTAGDYQMTSEELTALRDLINALAKGVNFQPQPKAVAS